MPVIVTPLDLTLDDNNPRFVVLQHRAQEDIRKYMAMYEDVCDLATGIDQNNGLLLGERIVTIHEDGKYIVMEGNRRTCALQFLLDRNIIPDGFRHKITEAAPETLSNITKIEIDVAPNRNYVIALMARRHIAGVKVWRPLAKKQFFASMFLKGNTVEILGERTGIKTSEIREDIRDYKFFQETYNKYKKIHPEYDGDLINLEIYPFLRIFSAKQQIESGLKLKPSDILKIKYDNNLNISSELNEAIFEQIVQMIFEATVIKKDITTRHTLFHIKGVKDLLNFSKKDDIEKQENATPDAPSIAASDVSDGDPANSNGQQLPGSDNSSNVVGTKTTTSENNGIETNNFYTNGNSKEATNNIPVSNKPTYGGPTTGGATPGTFFEHISWNNRLFPGNEDHDGLIVALDELHRISRELTKKKGKFVKVYYAFPVAAGMLLRTAYEQALILQLKKISLWNQLKVLHSQPMLSHIENYVASNITVVFPEVAMRKAFSSIKSAKSRDFLNSNIHNPGLIRTTSGTLEGLASGGIFRLIQLIINNI